MKYEPGDLPISKGSMEWFREYITGAYESLGQPSQRKVIDKALEYIDRHSPH